MAIACDLSHSLYWWVLLFSALIYFPFFLPALSCTDNFINLPIVPIESTSPLYHMYANVGNLRGKKHISVVSIWWMKWCRTIVWMTFVIEINWSSSRKWGTMSISTNDSWWNTVYLTNSTIKKFMRSFCISREFGLPAHTHSFVRHCFLNH